MSHLVVLVDGIVSAFARHLTPDVTWNTYVEWLQRRRPDLRLCHLHQPYDWVDIFSGKADTYLELLGRMDQTLQAEIEQRGIPETVTFLGFSLGGLTALALASRWSEITGDCAGRLSFITFGTPFAGASIFDKLFAKTSISYIKRVLNLEETKRQARQLTGYARNCPLLVLAHSIENDEMVNAHSSRMIADWLYFAEAGPNLQFGAHSIDPGTLLQPHNTLMQNHVAFAYIDGLLDGLQPLPDGEAGYLPPNHNDVRELRELARTGD